MAKNKKTKLPNKIRRIDDGVIFSLNENGRTYSVEEQKRQFPNSLNNEYSWPCLMELILEDKSFEIVKDE